MRAAPKSWSKYTTQASIRFLFLIHRSSSNVFQEYKNVCGFQVSLGHQQQGMPTATVTTKISDICESIVAWANAIKGRLVL